MILARVLGAMVDTAVAPALQRPPRTSAHRHGPPAAIRWGMFRVRFLALLFAAACISAVPPSGDKPCTVQTFYFDRDEDGVGVESATVAQCEAPIGYVEVAGDCDDADPAVIAAATWFADADGDAFGDADAAHDACDAPEGFVADATDCGDARADVHPGADEHCDGIDEDCDGAVDDAPVDGSTFYADADRDGYGDSGAPVQACSIPADTAVANGDCDDAVATVNPNADEHCDGLDEDCDGTADDNAVDEQPWYLDRDGDGYGVSDVTDKTGCEQPEGFGPYPDDCDDTDATVFPGATEACDVNLDANCDGSIGYVDGDGDGFAACVECDDADGAVNPAATEVCNGVDDDCDLVTDPDASAGAPSWYPDGDADGHGAGAAVAACEEPVGYVASSDDCDDIDGGVYPGASESCDTLDTDCDGETRDADSIDADLWHADTDGDSYGDAANTVAACDVPAGYLIDDQDCDDADASAFPGGVEVCDGADNDCDATVDNDAGDAQTWFLDADLDGYGDPSSTETSCAAAPGYVADDTDCDDADASVSPAASEVCGNGVADDCGSADAACIAGYTTAYGSWMAAISAGTFAMGGGAADSADAYMDHEVTLTHDFWIGETELTQEEWALFTAATDTAPSYFSTCGTDCPVETVSWYDAAKYCNALSTAEALTPCYLADGTDMTAAYVADPASCPGYRLPTEAEWEYAARADVATVYSGSDISTDVAWTVVNASSTTHGACGLAANAWGLCDMSGNVWEWVNDRYSGSYGGYGDGSSQTDPPGASSGSGRIVRGGDWYGVAYVATVSYRHFDYPHDSFYGVGFRLARSSP